MNEEINKKESAIKQMGSLIPSLTVLIIILGLIKEYLYYNYFNLPIKYFIGFSELGIIISDNLFLIIPSLIVGFFVSKTFTTSNKNAKPKVKTEEELKRLYNISVSALTTMVILLIILIYFAKFYTTKLFFFAFLCISGSLMFLFFFHDIIFKYLTKSAFDILYYCIILMALIFVRTSYELNEIDSGKYRGTIIKTADSTYISTNTSYFIGKSDKYVFIYNSKDSTSLIIPDESIKTLLIKENNLGNSPTVKW